MKRCPICRAVYPDDANFCPMDAGRLLQVEETPVPSLDLPTMVTRLIGGRFRLGPQIGGGRTGEVYSAEDMQTGQSVAVKLIAPAVFPTPLVAQRTERELKQLMKVQSERSVHVLDVGRLQGPGGDRMYVTMELVTGRTLAQVVATQGRLPIGQAVRLALEIGEALAEAAKLGVIHRDVAPKNVILLDTAKIKLINFGIPTPITDKVLGIPEFLSPEQAEGKPVDQRSNIYSVGALLYFMVTGSPPFTGEVDAVLRQQTQTAPMPPSQRVHGVVVPPDLERLVMKALEKPSSRRHLTLRQLLGELDAILPHTQGLAAQAPPRSLVMPVGPPPPAPPPPAVAPPTATPDQRTVVVHQPPSSPSAYAAGKTMVGMMIPSSLQQPRAPSAQPTQLAPPPPQQVAPPQRPQAVIVPDPPPPQQVFAPIEAPQGPAFAPTALQPAGPPPRGKAATQARAATPAPKGGKKKGKFRETMWFKKGELDEAVAASESEEAPVVSDQLPIEDRYKDDGTLTADDRERLSLRTGATQMMEAMKAQEVVPGDRMAPEDIVGELSGGRMRMILLVVGALVVLGMLIVYFTVLRH